MSLRDEFQPRLISWYGMHRDPELCHLAWAAAGDSEPQLADEIARASEWLSRWPKTTNINRRAGTSYGLKHRAEDWYAARGTPCYISNGALLMAAHRLGFRLEPTENWSDGFANAWLNIASAAGKYPAHDA
jgi:hypothetical protein